MADENQYFSLQEEVDVLNHEAWDKRVSDSGNALELSKSALSIAEKINYQAGLANALRTLGFTYIRISEHQQALACLERALLIFKTLNHLPGQSDIYEYFGIVERSLGNYESSLHHLFTSLELRQQTNYRQGESLSLYHLGVTYKYLGDYNQALDFFLQSLAIANEEKDWVSTSYCLNNIGLIHFENEDYNNALDYFNQSLVIRRKAGDKWGEAGCLDNIGLCYFKTLQLETAADYCTQGLGMAKAIKDSKGEGNSLTHLGNIYKQQNKYEEALHCYKQSLDLRKKIGDKKGESEVTVLLAELYVENNEKFFQEAFLLLNNALQIGKEIKSNDLLVKIHYALYKLTKKKDLFSEALFHLETYYTIEKEIHKSVLNQKIVNLEISHKVEKTKQETEIYRLRNIELANLYEEVKNQKKNLEHTLRELKSTQAQLIQSEKMASLGELTAGIAHEIQNPLNFVNNFSEINNELIDEMNAKTNMDVIKMIANDIKLNNEKINHHGKRADAIVKGMLQHSRQTKGAKEPTDINALCDEYLRLSYHGLRAKDKSFNADFKTDFDESFGKINIVPQDVGRVLLNLFNNAFYAVNEKKKLLAGSYQPSVFVQTRKINDKIEITVKDKGNGIPSTIINKIFQPFFTTKPTGQGTGLGLSIAYDIITKEHSGMLKAESKEGEGTTFVIQLPTA